MSEASFSHLDERGEVRMVDVSGKEATDREAVAESLVEMSPELARRLFAGELPKGDALASVRLAGIMAAKQTPNLIPLCHPLPLTGVVVEVEAVPAGARIVATVRTTARTGVEMEAMTAASVAALALYDMVKGVDKAVMISRTRLLAKRGGKSGDWKAPG